VAAPERGSEGRPGADGFRPGVDRAKPNLAIADEKKPEKTSATGKFKSFKDGVLTIAVVPVKATDKPGDATLRVPDDLKCAVFMGAEQKDDVLAKDALKECKPDTLIRLTAEGDKVIRLVVGRNAK
jgi:hypothetical protein